MDPPAGFVRTGKPAVAAHRAPGAPEGAHFRAAHHLDRPRRASSSVVRLLRDPATPITVRNACGLLRILEDAGQPQFRGVPARPR